MPADCTASVCKRNAGLRCDAADLVDRLERAEFVVGVHHGDQHGVRPQRAADIVRVHNAIAADRHAGDFDASPFERLAGVQHRMMLDGRGDDVARLRAGALSTHAKNGGVIGLGAAAGEDDFARTRADQCGDRFARTLDGSARALAEGMDRVGIAEFAAEKYGSIAARTAGSHGRGGVMVEVSAMHDCQSGAVPVGAALSSQNSGRGCGNQGGGVAGVGCLYRTLRSFAHPGRMVSG